MVRPSLSLSFSPMSEHLRARVIQENILNPVLSYLDIVIEEGYSIIECPLV